MNNESGYLGLAGAIIRQAILDYQTIRFSGNNTYSRGNRKDIFEDAREFLFTERLEQYLEDYRLDKIITADDIRDEARRAIISHAA